MKNNKKIITILIISLLALSLLASIYIMPAKASSAVVAGYTNMDSTLEGEILNILHPSGLVARTSAVGQCFKPTSSGYLEVITLYLRDQGAPNATLTMKLYNSSDADGIPTTLIETSFSVYNSKTSEITLGYYSFSFSGDTYLNLNNYYVWTIEVSTYEFIDTSNYFLVIGNNAAGYATGKMIYYVNGVWATFAAQDFYFTVIASDIYNPDPTPTPTATPTPTPTQDYKWDDNEQQWYYWNGTHWNPSGAPPTDTWSEDIFEFLGTNSMMLIALCIVFGVSILAGYYVGLLGFLAGLNISIILLYLFLGSTVIPLWVIIMLAVVDLLLILFGRDRV